MSALTVINQDGKSVGKVDFPDELLSPKRGQQALMQAVVTIRANQRSGTHSTKTKGEVAGSGKKPWRQKGTGRARAGYKQSPIWRGGGVVFGPKPRSYAKDITRKTAKLALRRALTDKITAEQVTVVERFELGGPKTKAFVAVLKGLKVDTRVLLVLDQIQPDVAKASRNVPGVEVVTAANLNSLQMLRYPRIIFSKPGLQQLQARLSGGQEN